LHARFRPQLSASSRIEEITNDSPMSISPAIEPLAAPQELDVQELMGVFRRRRRVFFQVFLLVLAAAIVGAAMMKPIYRTEAKLLVPASSYSLSVIDSNNPIGAMLAAAQPDSVSTQLQVLESAPFREEAYRLANVVSRPEIIPPSARVEAVADTNIIQIMVDGGDPREIARLANAMVKLHLKQTDLLETTGLGKTMDFVRKEKEKESKALTAAEARLLQFRQAHQGLDLLTEREARAGESTALQARALEVAGSITLDEAQIAHLKNRLAEEPTEISRPNPKAEKLQDKLEELIAQRVTLLREYRPASRPVRDLDEQIGALQQQLDASREIRAPNPVRAQLRARLEEQETVLQAQEKEYNAVSAQLRAKQGSLNRLGPWAAELTRLTHDRDAAQSAYSMLSDRLRDLEIRTGARLQTARAIEWAGVPTRPLRPIRTTTLTLGTLLALLLASCAVILTEYLDDRINAPEDVQRLSGLPTLGHIPLMPPGTARLLSALTPRSHIAEAYRALRSSIGFAGVDSPIRRLQVSSSNKGEGKSTTAANLAMAMAQDGKSVILVDADMRSPSVHRLLQCPRSPGLSEVLVGMSTLQQVLQPVEGGNLRVIAAGSAPPNPAELLGSPHFDEVMQQLEEQCDIVIVDTPPCVPVTDPVVISPRMQAVVLVVHTGQTRKAAFKQTIELLSHARAYLVGVVMNQVPPHGSYYYYRSQPYYYYGGDSERGVPTNGRSSRHRRSREPALAEEAMTTSLARRTKNGDQP
jgi:capsular exopolysaccharide synthesis family protein